MRERAERNRYLRRLENSLRKQGVELTRTASASEEMLNTLVACLDAREHEIKAHSRRVGEYSLHLAGRSALRDRRRKISGRADCCTT